MPGRDAVRTSETGRVEAFSDAVFAIALTLLVLDLRPPDGAFGPALVDDWEAYVAYLAAFLTIGSIWLSHHDVFTRVRRADPGLLALNLGVLLGASLVPWPTTLMRRAIELGSPADETAAILVFSAVTLLIGGPWTLLARHLARTPALLETPADAGWMHRAAVRNAGSIAVSVVGAAVGLVLPLVSLALYLVVPVLFIAATLRREQRAPEE